MDHNQPDVYETSELPEDDQGQFEPDELASESVERLNVNATDAFDKFKNKTVDASKLDFSDRVEASRKTGYYVPRTEYEIVAEGIKETPQQKFQRVQHEMRELAEEVTQIKASMKSDSSTEALSAVSLGKQVEYLQQQLTDLHLDKVLGQPGAISLADPHGALQKRLMTELDSFNTLSSSKPSGKDSHSATDSSHVTYQLYYRPEQAKFGNNARMADIEERLERIEALLGQNPEKVSMLTSDTANKSLLGAVAMLSAKTKLLEPAQLEQVDGRLHAVNSKLTQISEKKDAVAQTDKQNKVTDLYELVKKWDGIADSLPHIVERLCALKDLHEQALQFSQGLSHLDTAQEHIDKHLKGHTDLLKQVQKIVQENMNGIKGNIVSLDNRLKAVKK